MAEHKRRGSFSNPLTVANDEVEANIFAMELLMPEPWLRRDCASLVPFDIEHDPRIDELAERYQVHPQLMVLRLTDLGLI